MAFSIFVALTWLAVTQKPGPGGLIGSPAWSWRFWRDPIEFNALKRLQSIDADLRSVFALKDERGIHVWVGGVNGIILYSDKGGESWKRISPAPRQKPESGAKNQGNFDFSLVPRAQAAEIARKPSQPNQSQTVPLQEQLNTTDSLKAQKKPVRKNPAQNPVQGSLGSKNTKANPVNRVPPPHGEQPAIPVDTLTQQVDDIAFEDWQHGYVVSGNVWGPQGGGGPPAGYNGVPMFETTDGGKSWTQRTVFSESEEPKVVYNNNFRHKITVQLEKARRSFDLTATEGWAVGDAGTIWHTTDAGSTWVPQTQGPAGKQMGKRRPYRLPAPWYYAFLIGIVGMAAVALRPVPAQTVPPESETPGIANLAVSDRPLEPQDPDVLGCKKLAAALSGFIRNRNTIPPLTIAVTGEWGSGKSSVMNLLRRDLESFGLRPIWFNAWHNQTEDNLFATLLQNLRLQGIPRWWQVDFLSFRWRLLMIRLRGRWLPLTIYLCLVAALLGADIGHPHPEVHSFRDLLRFDDTRWDVMLVGILGAIAAIRDAFKKLKAFGVNPANLLASQSHRPSISDLDKQTSVRQQFAQELRDVTEALGARKMVIFIDDLDRCQPDNVCAVLEAVNFIISSGSCFVVMGLARRPVEASVGLSFSAVAGEMTNPTADPSKADTPASLRTRFARQYLDKLINIEIPVPPADGRAEGMITGTANEPGSVSQTWRYARRSIAVLLAAATISGGFWIGQAMNPASDAPQTEKQNPKLRETGGAQNTTASDQANQSSNVEAKKDQPQSNITPAKPVPDLADSIEDISRAITFGPFVILGSMSLVLIAYVVATRRTGLIVHDSPEFLQALGVWKEFIIRTHTTPRAIKRFMNRVRCTAMRVHPVIGGEPLYVAALRRVGNRWTWLGSQVSEFWPKPDPAEQSGTGGLRESTLVALTAIHDTSSQWLDLSAAGESGWLRSGMLPPDPRDQSMDAGKLPALLGSVITEHAKRFPKAWPPSSEQLVVFMQLMGSFTAR